MPTRYGASEAPRKVSVAGELDLATADDLSQGRTEARSFPADRDVLHEIRAFIRSRAGTDSFGKWADHLALAVSEACTNSILHSGTPEITVTWKPLPDRVEVEVRDEGIFRRALPSDEAGPAGRGILLMMSAMDQITITCGTDSRPGTVVRMVKLRNGGPRDATRALARCGSRGDALP